MHCQFGSIETSFTNIPSTHEVAIDLLSKSKPKAGSVIMAEFQSKGKGRNTNSWNSEAGKNLLLSFIIYPDFIAPRDAYAINVFSTLALLDLCAYLGIDDVRIKWPNDLLVGNLKLAGILIQNMMTSEQITASVLSMGINVNQKEWSEGIMATSLSLGCKMDQELETVRRLLYKYLGERYDALFKAPRSQWREFKSRLYGWQENKVYHCQSGDYINASIIDVLEDGKIVLDDHGTQKVFSEYQLKQII
jgi:BirA family biotin operon repressor/biotin-[acetyl-CoA-carboxylase] ligase